MFSGLVLFLEEDHYVTEDFLHVLNLVNEERLSRHEDCDIICLGTYLKSPDMKKTAKQVSQSVSQSVVHLAGWGVLASSREM